MDARINTLLAEAGDINNINIDDLDEETYDALMKRLEEDNERDIAEIKKNDERVSVLEHTIAQGHIRITELEEGIRKRNENIAKNMAHLAELNEEIRIITSGIEARNERIAAREEEIAALEKSIAKDEARLNELKESISAREARIAARDEENARDLSRLEKLKKHALELSGEIEQDKIVVAQQNLEAKQSLSIHSDSRSHTPPSDSDVLRSSSGDEDSSFSSDISDASPARRNSSSSDELDELKNEKKLSPKSSLSSSAIMSAALPSLLSTPSYPIPSLVGAGQVQPVIVDKSLQLAEEQKKQASADKARAFASPEKDKNLVAKLGLNRDKSAPLSQQQSSSSSVTPAIQQERAVFVR